MYESSAETFMRRMRLLVAMLVVAASPLAWAQSAQDDVAFYEPRSMLFQADQLARGVAGTTEQWRGPYMQPQPEPFSRAAPVWITIYPRAIIPQEGSSVMGSLADSDLWEALDDIGFKLMHPVAFLRAGGIQGREYTPSIDGGFDRISLEVEPLLGTEEDVRNLVRSAEDREAFIAGDVIPLHTGLGPDFRLAQMRYKDYAGMYDMIEIPREHWGLLPEVNDQWGFEVITNDQAQPLLDQGLIPGVTDVLLEDPESVNWSGWAATGAVPGVDGETRRWVYLHLFKAGQPVLNWMDPTYAGRRIQTGDMVRHVRDLGVKVNRLDAVPFLGLEPPSEGDQAQTYMTQLAIMGTNDLAFTSRKLGGWTFVELNVPTGQFREFMRNGADLGCDFFTRAQTVHPLINGDARIFRLAHRTVLESGIHHRTLIHDMQNHDEITYQLLNLGSLGEVQYGGETVTGQELKQRILEEMRNGVTGENGPWTRLYRPEQDGLATTFAGFIAAALDVQDPYGASEEAVDRIKRGHVLLTMANAMQPGVFAISQWDLVGALPIAPDQVPERTAAGDFRWINRGAVDLMGRNPDATESPDGLPVAKALYGPLPQQLQDPQSFASFVKLIVAARQQYRIGDAELVDVPEFSNQAVAALVMRLPDNGGVAVTALNYGREPTSVTVDLSKAAQNGSIGGTPRDIVAGEDRGELDGNQLTIELEELQGRTIVVAGER